MAPIHNGQPSAFGYVDLERAGLEDLLLARSSEDLLHLVKLLPIAKPHPTRKADRATAIMEQLSGERLRNAWEILDKLDRLAVAESLYDPDRRFWPDRFRAKYGKLPKGFAESGYWRSSPLDLYIHPVMRRSHTPTVVPVDLAAQLRAFVPEPPGVEMRSIAELPAQVRQPRREHVESGKTASFALVEPRRHDAEYAALREVTTLLRLVQANAVTVSATTRRPTAASVRRVAAVLQGGDFFDPNEKKAKHWEQVPGAVRAFAWPMLLQGGKLASLNGSELALTKAGRDALAAPPASALKDLWAGWITNPLFDEFSRVDAIKGQTRGKGKRHLTSAAGRRSVIADALAECPVGNWVLFDEFARFMRASSFDFEVTTEPWTLHLVERHYGSMGYSGNHDWSVLQGRYVLCVLFEYAATLGLIDIAYVRPENARLDFTRLSNADSLAYLSRYDGLIYFRVNPLGAYCLDLAPSYTPTRPEVQARLSVYPDGRIQSAHGSLGHDEVLLLETFAKTEDAGVWRLDRARIVRAIEDGRNLDELRDFFADRDEQELPEPVEGLLRQTERAARALRPGGSAELFECADAETLARLTQDRTVGPLCLAAGDRHLVVPEKSVDAFRKAVHAMGYGIPNSGRLAGR